MQLSVIFGWAISSFDYVNLSRAEFLFFITTREPLSLKTIIFKISLHIYQISNKIVTLI